MRAWLVVLAACSSSAQPPSCPPAAPAAAPAPAPALRIFVAPQRACVDHGELVLERDNECRDLTCTATLAPDNAIAVALTKHDERACKDSGTVRARCPLPRGARIAVNHGALFDRPADGTCRPNPPGVLAAGPPSALWPDRVRYDGGVLVFEHDCGCNDALLCTIDRSAPDTLAIALRKDPSRMPMCTDCFAMVPARCVVPPHTGALHVAINGRAAFDLPADAGEGSVWASRGP